MSANSKNGISADTEAAKAVLAHPVRITILTQLASEERSPNMLALDMGEPLGAVAYHVRKLDELGVLKLVSTRQRRGATEHIYGVKDSKKLWGAIFAHATQTSKDLAGVIALAKGRK